MKIFQKLSLGVLSSALLLGGVGFISWRVNQQIKLNVEQSLLKGVDTSIIVGDIQADLRKIESDNSHYFGRNTSGIPAAHLQKEERQEFLERLVQLEQKLLELNQSTKQRLKFDINHPQQKFEDEIELITIINDLQKKHSKLQNIVQNLLAENNSANERQLLSNQLDSFLHEEIYPLLEDYQRNFSLDQIEKTEVITKYLDNNDLVLGVATGVALILSLGVGIYTARAISLPLKQLQKAASQVGKGKLNVQLPETQDDEIGILAQTFNQMLSGLKETTVSKSYLDKILSSMVDSLIVVAPDGTIEKVNPATSNLLGYSESELIGKSLKLIWADEALDIQTSVPNFSEVTYLTKEGKKIPIAFSSSTLQNQRGEIEGLVCLGRDITEKKQAEEKLRYQANYDSLTGLPNRSFFLDKLKKLFELGRTTGQEEMFAVLFLDLDGFKKINDSLGHLVGDELLITFTRRLKECLRREDTLARLGGDEFAILVENIQQLRDAINVADRIFRELDKPFRLQRRELFISVSIGIAPSTNNYDQVENFLRDADTAMYHAKAAGKARYTVFQPQMYKDALTTLELENDLRRAIEHEEFQVFYQPIVKLTNRQIVGFEALVRWQHPEKGMVSPGKFIPLAEETGLIVPIGYWVMEQACRQMRQWQSQYEVAQNMTISVNLSPVQLNHSKHNDTSNCLEKIKKILEKTGLESHYLKLEITETTIMESLNKTTSLLEQIKALGIKLSMDDFGTGYSSLNYLHHLPLDTLKIDRSFVNELGINSDKLSLTRTIVNLAQSLRMDVIAEGIETNEQQAILTKLNCENGQGYLFSKPVSSTDAEILITALANLTCN
ncbi:MAG: EAL domain-containing protein [Prochloraceae cyanobacterium]|nr:EAL domain-containing protein [Prochloraceae cyanobacterium]